MKKSIICLIAIVFVAAGITACAGKTGQKISQDTVNGTVVQDVSKDTDSGNAQQSGVQETGAAGGTTVQSAGAKTVQQSNPQQEQGAEADGQKEDQAVSAENKSIVYKNTQFGFEFTLPGSWKNYKIISDKWEGRSLSEGENDKVVETGPQISIRHPEWTSENPRQDIPIMVFTLKQWDSMAGGGFHIGAAPMDPSELGRNNKYVFALPARYNYAFPTGFEEVEKILQGNALKPVEVK